MSNQALTQLLERSQQYFDRSISVLTEADSAFAPAEGTYTIAQMVAHVGGTIDWFVEGAFRPEGFDMDFEGHIAAAKKVTSLKEAREICERAFHTAIETIRSKSMDELQAPLPEGPVMGGEPRMAIVGGIEDHTAHHRGALTVYARLRGLEPPMPYM